MDILQHAVGVVGHLDAQVLAHAGVPGLGQVGEAQLAFHDFLLQLEAQDDVQVVGGLVGLHADERRLDLVDGAVEALRIDPGELLGEGGLQARKMRRQNGRLRPTRFSHIRLCDSCRPSDAPRQSGVRSSWG